MSIIDVKNIKDTNITLYPMKKIEIIVASDNEPLITQILKDANIQAFTLLRDISGQGHERFHEGKLLFNDRDALILFIVVASEEAIVTIAKSMKTLFQKNSGVMFVSDVSVARVDYFS